MENGSEDTPKMLVAQLIARAYPVRGGGANARIGPPDSPEGCEPLPLHG